MLDVSGVSYAFILSSGHFVAADLADKIPHQYSPLLSPRHIRSPPIHALDGQDHLALGNL